MVCNFLWIEVFQYLRNNILWAIYKSGNFVKHGFFQGSVPRPCSHILWVALIFHLLSAYLYQKQYIILYGATEFLSQELTFWHGSFSALGS